MADDPLAPPAPPSPDPGIGQDFESLYTQWEKEPPEELQNQEPFSPAGIGGPVGSDFETLWKEMNPPPPKGFSPVSDLARGLVKGVKYEVPGMLARSAQYLGIGGETADKVAKWSDEGTRDQGGAFEQAGSMIPPSVGVPLVSHIIGTALGAVPHPVAKLAGAAIKYGGMYATPALFGLSQAQETRERAKEAGVPEGIAPEVTGGIEWLGETLGNMALGKALGPFAVMGKAAKEAIMKAGVTSALKGTIGAFAKEWFFKTMPTEVGTEMLQNFFESAVEKEYQIRPEAQPLNEALSAVAPTVIMTAVMGPFGKMAHNFGAGKIAAQLGSKSEAQDPLEMANDMAIRTGIAERVAEILPEDTKPGVREAWLNYAKQKIQNNKDIPLDQPLDTLSMEIDLGLDEADPEGRSKVDVAKPAPPTEPPPGSPPGSPPTGAIPKPPSGPEAGPAAGAAQVPPKEQVPPKAKAQEAPTQEAKTAPEAEVQGRILKHFTTPEGAKALFSGSPYGKKQPSPYLGMNERERKTAPWYPEGTIFLSLNDDFWSKGTVPTGKPAQFVEATPENMKKFRPDIDAGRASVEFDYVNQKYQIRTGDHERKILEAVNYALNPKANIHIVKDAKSLDALIGKAGGEQDYMNPSFWSALRKSGVDAVEVLNSPELGLRDGPRREEVGGHWRFWDMMSHDQVVVLNPDAVKIQMPKTAGAATGAKPGAQAKPTGAQAGPKPAGPGTAAGATAGATAGAATGAAPKENITGKTGQPDPLMKKIAKALNYTGRKFRTGEAVPTRLDSFWEGGSKDTYHFYNIADGRIFTLPSNHPFFEKNKPRKLSSLPRGVVLVRHTISRGKDMGLTFWQGTQGAQEEAPKAAPKTEKKAKKTETTIREVKPEAKAPAGPVGVLPAPPEMGTKAEPWQITKWDYLAKYRRTASEAVVEGMAKQHEKEVRIALERGKEVPPEVLKDYQHLLKPKEAAVAAEKPAEKPAEKIAEKPATSQTGKRIKKFRVGDRLVHTENGKVYLFKELYSPWAREGKGIRGNLMALMEEEGTGKIIKFPYDDFLGGDVWEYVDKKEREKTAKEAIRKAQKDQKTFVSELESAPAGTSFSIAKGPMAGTWTKGRTSWKRVEGEKKGATVQKEKVQDKFYSHAKEIRESMKPPEKVARKTAEPRHVIAKRLAKESVRKMLGKDHPMTRAIEMIVDAGGLETEQGPDGKQRIVGYSWEQTNALRKLFKEYKIGNFGEVGINKDGKAQLATLAADLTDAGIGWEGDGDTLLNDIMSLPRKGDTGFGTPAETKAERQMREGYEAQEEAQREKDRERLSAAVEFLRGTDTDEALTKILVDKGFDPQEVSAELAKKIEDAAKPGEFTADEYQAAADETLGIKKPEGDVQPDLGENLSEKETFNLANPETEIGTLESKKNMTPTEGLFSLGDILTSPYQETAKRLGIMFNGLQEWPKPKDGSPQRAPMPYFTDPVTGSTFGVMEGETAEGNLVAMREKFGFPSDATLTGIKPVEQEGRPVIPDQGAFYSMPIGPSTRMVEVELFRQLYSNQEKALVKAFQGRDGNGVEYTPEQIVKDYEKATGKVFPFRFLLDQLRKAETLFIFSKASMPENASGAFLHQSNRISLREIDLMGGWEDRLTMFERTFAHEAIHAIIINMRKTNFDAYTDLIDRMKQFRMSLRPALNVAPEHITKFFNKIDEIYSTSEGKLAEIITYGLTHPELARWLNTIPTNEYISPTQQKTMWTKFKEMIMAAIGRVTNATKTKLDELAQIMDDYNVYAVDGTPIDIDVGDMASYQHSDLLVERAKTMYAQFRNPNYSEDGMKIINQYMGAQKDLGFMEKILNIPWTLAEKYPLWREAFRIMGINRPEWRGELTHQFAKMAEPFFKFQERMRKKGMSQAEIDKSRLRVSRAIITGDAVLGPKLKAMKAEYAALGPESSARKNELAQQISRLKQENGYSAEELRNGIVTDRGETIKFNEEEIAVYKAVRKSLDHMFNSYLDHLTDQQFRTYQNQKWYAILTQIAGIDLSKNTTMGILKSGLDKAALLRAIKIQPNIRAIFDRVDDAINEDQEGFALAATPGGLVEPEQDRVEADRLYKKISDKMVENIKSFEETLGEVLGLQGGDLSEASRAVFYAYLKTRPQMKRIKALRNEYSQQVAFFPRVREEGRNKLKLVETLFNDEGMPIGEVQHFMGMFDDRRQGLAVHKEMMDFAKRKGWVTPDGKLPYNFSVVPEVANKTPEYGFEGVNDINVQKIYDNALQDLQFNEMFYDEEGKPVNVQEALRELGYQAIARQFQARGFGKHMIHRQVNVVKGYIEGDKPYGWSSVEGLEKVLFNYMTGMAGIMSKQTAAADFLDLMKTIPRDQTAQFKALQEYGRNQLRNESKADKISNKVRSFMFTWYLGGVLRPAIIQLTQNFITGIPKHAQYLRENGIGGIGKADRDYAKAFFDVPRKRYTPEEARMEDDLLTQGVTIDQYIRDVYSSFGDPMSRGYKKMLKGLAYPFSKMEQLNRQAAALTRFRPAFQLALKAGMSREAAYQKAFEEARSFVYNTHYAMGKANLPLWAQGEGLGVVAKTLYTFRPFTHNFVLQTYNDLKKGDFRTVMHSMAYIALFGGLMGLPFFKDIFEFLEAKFGWDFPRSIRQTLRAQGGKTLENLGMGGIPAMLGTNISGSIALNVPFMGETPLDTLYGVYGGQYQKMKRAGQAFMRGDVYRGTENLAPEVLRGPMAALRMSEVGKALGTPGMATTPSGQITYDERGKPMIMGPFEAGAKALGFQPTEFATQGEKEQTVNRLEAYFTKKKTSLGENYRVARINKDPKALTDLAKGVKALNKEIRAAGNLVAPASIPKILQSSRERMTRQKAREMRYKSEA